ncbi:hypothetical protein GALMADRAFT_215189 [Galerina marginata CBS 339.88]|uniref:F-box domain-containing protein n=1 Tax=Galerina marginata (strain CBS 339.88) TaxID=685588 RepID=A0A067SF34_GALM3|nr:hypothetical protein GALMADRAFT_215189 [Galerina marginata CBS 339.88]
MDTVPAEIVLRIASSATKKDISSLSNTSKSFLDLLRPLLFREIVVTESQKADLLSEIFTENPQIGALVHSLGISVDYLQIEKVAAIVRPLLNIRKACISAPTDSYSRALESIISDLLARPRLENLHIENCPIPTTADALPSRLTVLDVCLSDLHLGPSTPFCPITLSIRRKPVDGGGFVNTDWTTRFATENLQTLILDWPETSQILECPLPKVKCIKLFARFNEGTPWMAIRLNSSLEDFTVCLDCCNTVDNFSVIVNSIPDFFFGVVAKCFTLKLTMSTDEISLFLDQGGPLIPGAILHIQPTPIIFLSIKFPRRPIAGLRSSSHTELKIKEFAWFDLQEQRLQNFIPTSGLGWEPKPKNTPLDWNFPRCNDWECFPRPNERRQHNFETKTPLIYGGRVPRAFHISIS